MKKCPFCAEEVQDAAIKCRYCHESLDSSKTNSQVSSKNIPQKVIVMNQVSLTNPTKWKNVQQLGIILIVASLFVIFNGAEMVGFIMIAVGLLLKIVGKARHEYYWKDGL